MRAERRRKIRWSRVFLLIVILIAFVVSFASAAFYAYNGLFRAPAPTTAKVAAEKPAEKFNKNINILLLGVDDGDTESGSTAKRSDTMMLASINPDNGAINLLSIPRDTQVSIPGRKGVDKITHAYFYGGPQLAVRTVENFLQLPVNYYVTIDWQAFIKVIDILGGVDLYVENNMDYEDPYADLRIHLNKGYQHLDGEKAGQYVRFRHDELGDIGRVQRQQRFLKALSDEALQVGTIVKLPALASTISQYVATNMSMMDTIKLANNLKGFKNGALHTEMLPGQFATVDGLSYWIPDQEQTKQLVERMFTSGNAKTTGIYSNNDTHIN
ncbi:LCP family protein [bacterium BFN5]|nr:LCP family protein [bacterium BFN5]QJW46460.1 LCP family protein [bacterium BFN5]